MPRKESIDPTLRQTLLDYVRAGATPESAARAAGLPDGTLDDWLALADKAKAADRQSPYRDLQEALALAQAEARTAAEIQLRKTAPAAWLHQSPKKKVGPSPFFTPGSAGPRHKEKAVSLGSKSPLRDRFVAEYLIDFNGTQAAIRAGYSKRSAYSTASMLLKNSDVIAAIREGARRQVEAAELTVEIIDQELRKAVMFDPATFYNEDGSLKPIQQIPLDARRMLTGMEVEELFDFIPGEGRVPRGQLRKLRFQNRFSVLELATRRLGMLKQKVELTGRDGKPLVPITVARLIIDQEEAEEENGGAK